MLLEERAVRTPRSLDPKKLPPEAFTGVTARTSTYFLPPLLKHDSQYLLHHFCVWRHLHVHGPVVLRGCVGIICTVWMCSMPQFLRCEVMQNLFEVIFC